MAWPETAMMMMVSTMPISTRDHKAEVRGVTRAGAASRLAVTARG
jgi:hypothetical protein